MKTDPILDKCFYIVGWVMIALAAGVFAAAELGVFDQVIITPCMLHSMTGLYCPGCGGTRAIKALLQGKWLWSLYYHPLVPYTAVFGGWFMISQTVCRISGGRLRIGMHYRNIYLWLALAIVVVNCLVKNLVLVVGGIALMG